jgi:preprotein translocase subunit SecD
MRSLVAVLLAASLLTGCVSREGDAPEGDKPADPKPVELAVPIEVRPVLETESTDPTVLVLPTEDGERLTMTDPIFTIRGLDGAEVTFEQNAGTWVLNLDLDDADGDAFGGWTTEHVGERLALVADQEVLMAPQIQSAITGGEIQITANYTRDEAEDLLDKITGE